MEQDIRFCTTSDGVRIAYAVTGSGPPLVRSLGWFTHLEFEWQNLIWRHLIDGLSVRHTLIRYDGRGMGLSDRNVNDFSLPVKVTDLEAVVDAMGLRRFALYGVSEGGATAISYASRHPERVDRLILYGSCPRYPHPLETEEQRGAFQAGVTLARFGWGQDAPAYRQFFTSLFMPDADAEAAKAYSEMERISVSPENAARFMTQVVEIDVTDLLPHVKAPTLVIHRRGDIIVPFEAGRELASQIAGAKFVPLEGRNHLLLPGEAGLDTYFNAVKDFLAEGRKSGKRKARTAPGAAGLVTIMFTDMEGSTALTQRLGDAKAQEVLRAHNAIIRDALKTYGGSETKHTGDGIMASFGSAVRALECAVAIQKAFADPESTVGAQGLAPLHPDQPLRVRIGLNAGEPVAEDGPDGRRDLFGATVQLAARVCNRAEPGQVLVSNVVRELAMGKDFLFHDIGDFLPKGFEDPVRLYEVRRQDNPA